MENFTLQAHLQEFEKHPDFIYEQVLFDMNELICQRMVECGVSRSQLAERMGVNKGYISRILNGPANLTLKTVVNVLHALGARPRFVLCDEQVQELEAPMSRKKPRTLRTLPKSTEAAKTSKKIS